MLTKNILLLVLTTLLNAGTHRALVLEAIRKGEPR